MSSVKQRNTRRHHEEPTPAPPTKTASVFVWEKDKENEYTSKGKVVQHHLPVSDDFDPDNPILTTKHIKVIGMRPFIANKKPKDSHSTRTQNHDSFDQAIAFKFYQQVQKIYERLSANSFGTMVGAKTNLVQFKATVNGVNQMNAFYHPASESMVFGTSNGQWDLASDGDIVIHEMGHFILDHLYPNFWSSNIHESYGDQLSAFSMLDPDLSEDTGVILSLPPGEGLRNALNNLTISNAGEGPHAQGQVYTGLMWDLGELMHEQITGTPRRKERDREPLNQDAADACLSILFEWPLRIGTAEPSNAKWVATIEESIYALKRANRLHPKIDVDAVIAKLKTRALEREILGSLEELNNIDKGMEADNVATLMNALQAMFAHIGTIDIEYNESLLSSVDASKLRRGTLYLSAKHNEENVRIPIYDDLVTLTRYPSYLPTPKYKLEIGELRHVTTLAFNDLPGITLDQEIPLDMMDTWVQKARAQAKNQLDDHRGASQSWAQNVTRLPNANAASMMREKARQALATDQNKAELFFQDGVLKIRLDLDTLSFTAPVTREGIREGILESAIIID